MDSEGHVIDLPQPEPQSDASEETQELKIIEDKLKLQRLKLAAKKVERLRSADFQDLVGQLKQLGSSVRAVTPEDIQKEVERYNKLIPENEQAFREALDKRVEGIVDAKEAEEEFKKRVPQIALRLFDETSGKEKGWEQVVGWEDAEKRKRVLEKLKERLDYTDPNDRDQDNQARQAMYALVGTGQTADEVLAILDDDTRYNQYKNWDTKKQHDYEKEIGGRPQGGEITPQWVTLNKIDEDARLMDIGKIDRKAAIKFLYLHDELGIENTTYISRAILNNEFRSSLRDIFDSTMPRNLYDLAWNMGYNFDQFGINGKYPILQMQVEKGPDGKMQGRYVVDRGNFVRWFRDQQWRWYETFDTQAVTDYFSKIELHKGPMYSVNLMTMLFDKERYFSDETGYQWEGLYGEVLMEPWMLLFLRTYQVELDAVDDDIAKLKDKYKEQFHLSKLTMNLGGLGRSMIERLSTMPVDYTGIDSDTKVGEAMLKMLLAYYHMADYEELQKVMGADSPFFTRQGWIEAAEKVYQTTAERTHLFVPEEFFGYRQENFSKAFAPVTDPETGEVTWKVTPETQKEFLKFINFYNTAHPPAILKKTYDQIVRDCVSTGLVTNDGNPNAQGVETDMGKVKDELSLNYAWLIADALTFPSGATARGNFPEVSGHKAETRYFFTDAYRLKYMGFGGAGAFSTVFMFPQTSLPLFEGILLENKFDLVSYYDEKKGKMVTKKRYWTQMELMDLLNKQSNAFEERRKVLRGEYDKTTDDDTEKREQIMKQLDEIDEEAKNFHKAQAIDFAFNENAMREWSKNLHGRGSDIYDQLMKGSETAFDKFTVYDGMFRGPSFKRDEWQDALQAKYITPLRYLFDANGATQLNMKRRFPEYKGYGPDGKPQWEWREMYVGERMLGHQVADIPEFRMQVNDLKPSEWVEMRKQGYKQKGKYVVRPDGRNMINYDRMQDDKPMVYKQFLLMKLAGDLHHHISRHTTDPQYSLDHFENIIKAIEELPGNLLGNQYDLRGNFVSKPFFSHEQIKWLRKVAGANQKWRTEWWKAIVMGDPHKQGGGIGESTNLIVAAIFKGY